MMDLTLLSFLSTDLGKGIYGTSLVLFFIVIAFVVINENKKGSNQDDWPCNFFPDG